MIAVVGCGNANRSDDAAGLEVVRLLRERRVSPQAPTIRLLDAGTDGMAVMFAARGCRRLIIVDACITGAEPGAIFEVPGTEIEPKPVNSFTLHDFRWDHALHAGRQIFRDSFPSDVTVFLIEAQRLELGTTITPPVREAARTVAQRIAERLDDARADSGGAP